MERCEPGPESSLAKKIFLAQNMIQGKYLGVSTKLAETGELDITNLGNDFRTWFNSPQGTFIVNEYAREHTEEEIERLTDGDRLIEEFEAYRSRTIH